MKAIAIKLPEEVLERLRGEARTTGCTLASVLRRRIEAAEGDDANSVYAITHDLAGNLAGARRSASNARRKFRRS